jgi:hypothetical protein
MFSANSARPNWVTDDSNALEPLGGRRFGNFP